MNALARAVTAEFSGTAALLIVIVGSGIMAERLSPANAAVALLCNALATGLGLFVLVAMLAPVSHAHLNPVVTLAAVVGHGFSTGRALAYVIAQVSGAVAGVCVAHAMFDLPLLGSGTHARTGTGQWLSEIVATAGLLLTIGGFVRYGALGVGAGVGAYIAAAYWFTASTSFANPAVTVARALTPTFSGIRPADAIGFIVAQLAGTVLGLVVARILFGPAPVEPGAAPLPHRDR